MLKMLLFLSELESESKKSWKSSHEQHLNRFSPPPPRPKSWKNGQIRHAFAERLLSSAICFIKELTFNPNFNIFFDPRMQQIKQARDPLIWVQHTVWFWLQRYIDSSIGLL